MAAIERRLLYRYIAQHALGLGLIGGCNRALQKCGRNWWIVNSESQTLKHIELKHTHTHTHTHTPFGGCLLCLDSLPGQSMDRLPYCWKVARSVASVTSQGTPPRNTRGENVGFLCLRDGR